MPGPITMMRLLRRFSARSRADRALVLRAVRKVALIRLGLWLLHPSYVLRRVETAVESRGRGKGVRKGIPVATIAWAVRASSRVVPGATCLTQALATRSLLAVYGHTSDLRIGVARSNGGDLEAHAWLEVEGIPVIGGGDTHRYSTFPDLAGSLPVVPKRFRKQSS